MRELQYQETFTWSISNAKENRMSREEYLKKCEEVEDTAYHKREIHRHLEMNYYSKTSMPLVLRSQA